LTRIEVIGEDGTVSDERPIERDGDVVTLACEPGVFGYRLKP
jgi:hypothetical protein